MIELNQNTLSQENNSTMVGKAVEVVQNQGSSMTDTLQMVDQILSRIDSILGKFGVNLADQIGGMTKQAPDDPFGAYAFEKNSPAVTRSIPSSVSPPPQVIDVTGEEPATHHGVMEDPVETSFTKEQLQNALDKIIDIGGGDLTLNELRTLSEELPDVIDVPQEVLDD
ncbi:MAG: hypothetical protein SVM80_12890 [Halobacteriota archaeon]|nr:hypothetical protein [Halobacteriota archaeon]